MAILKHIAVKNADYGDAQRYLFFEHDPAGMPVQDASGRMKYRAGVLLDGINCSAFTFDAECRELNDRFGKNKDYDEIKSHHYIISYDPKDTTEHGLTGERAQALGLEYAAKYFPGHQTLVCTHTDGHNGSGNIHTHIVINSVRKYDVARKDFMERPCDSRAGYKHHLTKTHLEFLKQSVMDMCRDENLHQVELLDPAKKRIPDREYYAKRREQKKAEAALNTDGAKTQQTNFQTQKQFLRDAVEDAARLAHDTKEFQKILLEKYNVVMKESRGRFSYLHPERKKFITGRSLGTLYDTSAVLEMIADKEKIPKRDTEEKSEHQQAEEPTIEQNRNQDMEHPAAAFENSENRPAESNSISRKRPDAIRRMPDKNRSGEPAQDYVSVLFFHSELRLIIDLQSCIKAQQSQAYARKLKITNLKRMAETLAYIQERGYDTREVLEDELSGAKAKTTASRKSLKETETRLKEVNEQIHYTGQYLANKSVYTQFLKSKNKGNFRQEHTAEITLYETAAKFLKDKLAKDAPNGKASGKLPSLKLLKEEKEKLLQEKESRQDAYRQDRDRQKELDTVCSNVDAILDQPARQMQKKKQVEQGVDMP